MKLVDQWARVEANLPHAWEEVRLTLTTEQPAELARAAHVLGSMGAGRVGDALVLHVRRAGGASGPEAARRLFARLDADRVWCLLSADDARVPAPDDTSAAAAAAGRGAPGVVAQWDAALAALPGDWSQLLCQLIVASSDLLPRAALLCAPINPTREDAIVGFVFRCAQTIGYGVSDAMARRCFERLEREGIEARVSVLRVLSDTRHVATQGPVWLVDGRVL